MARTRSIKPEYFDDEKLAKVSRDSRLTFVGMWTNSDDWGIVKGNHLWLKSQVFPYDSIEPETFTEWVDELQRIGVIIPFDSHGESYYLIVNWSKHQRVDHPSKTFRNPEPPKNIRDGIPEGLAKASRKPRDETEVKLKLKQNINRSKTETKESPKYDDVVCDLSDLLLKRILENKPDRNISDSWMDKTLKQIDLMIRKNKRDPETIREIIEWCQSDNEPRNNGFCWAPNILSGEKLRKQFDRLQDDMKRIDLGGKSGQFSEKTRRSAKNLQRALQRRKETTGHD